MWDYNCESIRMSGNCGDSCPVFADGNCEIWDEIPNRDLFKDEYDIHITEYKRVQEEERIRLLKIEQIKDGNMEAPFKIDEEFIAKLLVDYYSGDNSLKNPLKMFKENKVLSHKIFEIVDTDLKGYNNTKIFVLDMYLNGYRDILNYKSIIVPTLMGVLMKSFQGINKDLLNSMYDNFFEADLSYDDFIEFGLDIPALAALDDSNKYYFALDESNKYYLGERLITTHKDFDAGIRSELFAASRDEFYLSHEAKDIFIF